MSGLLRPTSGCRHVHGRHVNAAAADELARIARNVAENREWAGLHYPSDTTGGRELARRFAPYLREAFRSTFSAAQREWI